jgi:hypothetical protein
VSYGGEKTGGSLQTPLTLYGNLGVTAISESREKPVFSSDFPFFKKGLTEG